MTAPVELRLLGPIEARIDGRPWRPTGKQAAVLAFLALERPRAISADDLVERLWGADPPETARHAVQVYVSRVRRALGSELIETVSGSYRLAAGAIVDVDQLVRLERQARADVAAGRVAEGRVALEAAARIQVGAPLAGAEGEELDTARRALESRAIDVVERLAELRLDVAVGGTTADLEHLVAEHPLRERLRGLLMRSLYRDGRQTEALRVYREGRDVLRSELGLEPGPELRRLERLILEHDPEASRGGRARLASLPAPLSSFVGRRSDLHRVRAQLQRPEVRLVTLVGPGGVGKTRLALEAAREVEHGYGDGAVFVDLTPLADAAYVLPAIGDSLGQPVRGDGAADALARLLRLRHLLVVLDNLEHLPGAADTVRTLLERCPDLTVLATSRDPLRLAGEQRVLIEPLALDDAVSLFVERSRAIGALTRPDETVAELCRRLDCLPLALELAAARTSTLAPSELLARIAERLDLEGDVDLTERHRTVRATIGWSAALLRPSQRSLLPRLAIFAGGCTLEAVEQVCDGHLDDLSALVERSLVQRHQTTAGSRFRLLETVQDWAGGELRADEATGLRATAAEWYTHLAEREAAAVRWLEPDAVARVDAERDNLRLAAAHALGSGDRTLAFRLLAALCFWWMTRSKVGEGDAFARAALDLPGTADERLEVSASMFAGELARYRGDLERAAALKERAIAALHERALEDESERWLAAMHADATHVYVELEQLEDAARHAERALKIREALGEPSGIGHARQALAAVAASGGDLPRAIGLLEEAAAGFDAVGATVGVNDVRIALADVLRRSGDALAAMGVLRRQADSLRAHPDDVAAIDFVDIAAACLVECGLTAEGNRLFETVAGLRSLSGYEGAKSRERGLLAARTRGELGPVEPELLPTDAQEALANAVATLDRALAARARAAS